MSSFKEFSEKLHQYRCKNCNKQVMFISKRKEDFQMVQQKLCRKCFRKRGLNLSGKARDILGK